MPFPLGSRYAQEFQKFRLLSQSLESRVGPYHYGVAQPHGSQAVLFGQSENWQSGGQTLFHFWVVRNCVYPHWFLATGRKYYSLFNGRYTTLDTMKGGPDQVIYIYNDWHYRASWFVHTPYLDDVDVYAIFDSDTYGRDWSWRCSAIDLAYRTHVRIPAAPIRAIQPGGVPTIHLGNQMPMPMPIDAMVFEQLTEQRKAEPKVGGIPRAIENTPAPNMLRRLPTGPLPTRARL